VYLAVLTDELTDVLIQSVSDGLILLKGKAGQRPVEFSITLDSMRSSSPVDAALPIHRLAAKAQIKQLEDGEKGTLLLDLSALCQLYPRFLTVTSNTTSLVYWFYWLQC